MVIFDWEQRLVLGFIRDFERIIISDLPSVSPCIQEGRFAMVNRISATLRRVPVIRFRYERPDQRGFSFCYATMKSRKQFAARNSHKGDGRTAVRAILFNDGTLKRRGHLIHFRHESRQIPLPSVAYIFVRKILRPPITELFFCTKIPFWYAHDSSAALEYRLSVDSQTIQRSVSALSAACFCSQQTRFRLLYIAFDPLLGSPSEGLFCDRFLSVTLFLF